MTLAVVLPVLHDAGPLAACLGDLRTASPDLPTYVVDGAQDPTVRRVADDWHATYLTAPRGRASQQNAGAREALKQGARWLWFLHADCRVPAPCLERLQAHCQGNTPGWGSFRHRIDGPSPALRLIEWGNNWRGRLGKPYGDQGLFVHAQLFEQVGGFPEEPILEDLLLVRALGRLARPRQLRPALGISARRWQRLGVARTTWRNWRILLAHRAGRTDLQRLAELYTEE